MFQNGLIPAAASHETAIYRSVSAMVDLRRVITRGRSLGVCVSYLCVKSADISSYLGNTLCPEIIQTNISRAWLTD